MSTLVNTKDLNNKENTNQQFTVSVNNNPKVPLSTLKNILEKIISKNSPKKSSDELRDEIEEVYSTFQTKGNAIKDIDVNILLETARENAMNDKYGYVYKNIINLFTPLNEKLIKILHKCIEKLKSYNETVLADELEWARTIINNEFMHSYSININNITDINAINFFQEYSIDPLNRSKEHDIKRVRDIFSKRDSLKKRNSCIVSFKLNKDTPYNITRGSGSSKKIDFERKKKKSVTVMNTNKANIKTSIKEIKDDTDTRKEKAHSHVLKYTKHIQIDNKSNAVFNFESENEKDDIELETTDNIPVKQPLPNITPIESTTKGSSISNRLLPQIEKLTSQMFNHTPFDSFDFNIFDYITTVGRENVLGTISKVLMSQYDFFTFIHKDYFNVFIDKIRIGYDYLVPFHNDIHASDVLQTTHVIISHARFLKELDLTALDICALLLSCVVHDFKHPGLNNSYLINSGNEIAVKYNDTSVLEQYHISSAFKVISKPNSNIFVNISKEEYRIARKRMIECVLSTDMAKHTKAVNQLKSKIEQLTPLANTTGSTLFELLVNYVPEDTKFDRQQVVLNYIIHCADVSNTAKPFNICKKWTDLLMVEFFAQGDKEKKENLPVSFLCDREKTNVANSQVVFIKNIILPAFSVLITLIPDCNPDITNLEENTKKWEEIDKEAKNEKM